ncbi:MAG: MOSC domain-containing protein [Dehalococcoidia bacterium]|nr:MOSC domain-containing protein [Dehalococcoidia bacterium]
MALESVAAHAFVEAVCTRAEASPMMRKPVVSEVELVPGVGVRGDVHAGRGDRQVTVLPAEVLDALQGEGFAVGPGDMGENLVVRGLPEDTYRAHAVLVLADGGALEVVEQRTPCRELNDIAPGLLKATVRRCGYFARVIQGGRVRAGTSVRDATMYEAPLRP